MTQCTATSKRTGERCGAQAITGRSVCRHHGGRSPLGIASPGLKTGRYSKHLPTRLLATYETARRDPELLALRDDIGLIDARLAELLAKIETGESGAAWEAAKESFAAFREATARQDVTEARVALVELGQLIDQGVASEIAWRDIRATLEQRRRLVESERKRLVEMQMMVSAEDAALLVRTLTEAVRDHVRDPGALRAIVDALGRVAPLARPD